MSDVIYNGIFSLARKVWKIIDHSVFSSIKDIRNLLLS